MSIRLKIILIVLPLVVAALLLTGGSSYFAASNGISRVAKEFLAFKSSQLRKHAESQWTLLVENGLTGREEMVAATREAVAAYAASLATSTTELTAAFGADGSVATATGKLELAAGEREAVSSLALAKNTDYLTVTLGGVQRVGNGFWFEPFGWYVLVTEERSAFYAGVNEILVRSLIILGAAIAASVALVLVFAGWLTRPLGRVVATMRQIITTNDLGERVQVEYKDEIGQLAQTFNLMVEGLEDASGQIRRYARSAGMARERESRTKKTFERFAPRNVVIQAINSPDGFIQGEKRQISVLFSHVKGFAEISEKIKDPSELVEQLNRYFEPLVKIVMDRGGIVDKYINDAVMALFGHGEKHEDDEMRSVLAAFDMLDAVEGFNREQLGKGKQEFPTSIGISYGEVTVGNLGCREKKMSYTVIGDRVNLASRAQGMCKVYRQPLIFTETVYRKASGSVPCRIIDSVKVKGKKEPEKLYTAGRTLAPSAERAWNLHNEAMDVYFPPRRDFARAAALFAEVRRMLPGDYPSSMMIERCRAYQMSAPPDDWDGSEVMRTK